MNEKIRGLDSSSNEYIKFTEKIKPLIRFKIVDDSG